MSRIYFHTKSGKSAELRGSERAWMGVYCMDMLHVALGLADNYRECAEKFLPLIPSEHYLHTSKRDQYFCQSLKTYLSVGWPSGLLIGGKNISGYDLSLNTALALGSDPVKLMARIHGQCEIHCWVAGGHRNWLAGIIRNGREVGILREDQGWEGVIEFLESDMSENVVLSYSVCESFPDISLLPPRHPISKLDENGEEKYDRWEALGRDEQWDLCFRQLSRGKQLRPKGWDTFYFNSGETAFSALNELKIRSAAEANIISAQAS